MASRRVAVDAVWIESLGHSIGVQLGRAIAKHLQATLADSVDLGAVAKQFAGASGGRRGQKLDAEATDCSSPGCANPVLARSLCRSHYYKARYRSKKSDGAKKRPQPGPNPAALPSGRR